MSYIITMVSILVLIAAGLVVLTYNGVFTDKDKDGIPDTIEDKAQAASASLWASQDQATLAMINYDGISTLSNITNSTVTYDAWTDSMAVTWDNATNTVLQGVFFNNDNAIGWTQATNEVYDGFYGDTPPISVNEMYSAYSYNVSEEIANNAPGYDVNAKLYDPVQLATDVIVVQNGSLGGTNYNNQNGNLGSAGPGVMDNTATVDPVVRP